MLSLSKLLWWPCGVNFAWKTSGVPIKQKREIMAKNDFNFATYVPHTKNISSLKRKSQCHWWSQRWRSKLFQTSLFSSSFLQVQSTTNCLFTSYPMLRRDARSSCMYVARPDPSDKCSAIVVILTGDLYMQSQCISCVNKHFDKALQFFIICQLCKVAMAIFFQTSPSALSVHLKMAPIYQRKFLHCIVLFSVSKKKKYNKL